MYADPGANIASRKRPEYGDQLIILRKQFGCQAGQDQLEFCQDLLAQLNARCEQCQEIRAVGLLAAFEVAARISELFIDRFEVFWRIESRFFQVVKQALRQLAEN